MSLNKKPGPLLTSKFKGLLDVIPAKWRAKLGMTTLVQQEPVDVDPHALGDTVDSKVRVVSNVQQERTDERKKTDIFIGDPVGSQMVEYFRTKDGQIGTRTHTVRNEGDALPSLTELIIEADQEAWGNGQIEQVVSTIPNLLGLYDYRVERPDRTPPDFGSLLNTTEESYTVAGLAALPTLSTGELMREERQIDAQTKRVTVRYRDLASLPMTIVNKDTNEVKQVVTITRIWELDTATPEVPTALKDVTFDKLGDGTAIETRKTIGAVFDGHELSVERPDRTPPDFGALLKVTEESEIVTGTVSLPSLAAGELFRSERQLTEFTKKVTVRSRDVASLPKTIVNKDTSRTKQVITITRIWELDTTTPATPTATLDVTFEKLGDGTAIETQKSEAVFPGPVYGISIENLIPPKFRAHLATKTSELTSTGTANPSPTLATGELSHEEQQVDAFNIRTKSVTFDSISPPVTFTDKETTSELGGAEIDVIYTLQTSGTLSVETGLLFLSSEITDLGNGYEIRVTKKNHDSSWPELDGQEYDKKFDIVTPYTQQVEAAGTGLGTNRTIIDPLDQWKQRRRTVDATALAALLDSYVLSFPGTKNVSLPAVLESVQSIIERNRGDGDTATPYVLGFWSGHGAYSFSTTAGSQASAAIIAKVGPIIREARTERVSTVHYMFFLPSPVTVSAVKAKLATLIGSGVSDWPVFNTRSALIFSVGQRLALRVSCDTHDSNGGSDDSCEGSQYANNSASREVGLIVEATHIPPTLHTNISISGDTSASESLTASADASTSGDFGSCAAPAISNTRSEEGEVNASITAYGLEATDPTDIPNTGWHLIDVDAEPYEIGYVSIHAEVLDASSL